MCSDSASAGRPLPSATAGWLCCCALLCSCNMASCSFSCPAASTAPAGALSAPPLLLAAGTCGAAAGVESLCCCPGRGTKRASSSARRPALEGRRAGERVEPGLSRRQARASLQAVAVPANHLCACSLLHCIRRAQGVRASFRGQLMQAMGAMCEGCQDAGHASCRCLAFLIREEALYHGRYSNGFRAQLACTSERMCCARRGASRNT